MFLQADAVAGSVAGCSSIQSEVIAILTHRPKGKLVFPDGAVEDEIGLVFDMEHQAGMTVENGQQNKTIKF